MANDGEQDPGGSFAVENEADLLFGRAHPNPGRVGCPPRESLIELARRQLAVGDPVADHVTRCSPCYREVRAIQQAERIGAAEDPRASRSWWPAAAAAVLVVAAGLAAWFAYGNRQPAAAPTHAPEQIVADAEPVEVTLDLRKYSVTRSDAPAEELPPLVLPRAKVRLTLLLPVGSEAGLYEVRVVGGDVAVLASATGRGEIKGYLTSVAVRLDLHDAPPARYNILVRRAQESWTSYPVEVREARILPASMGTRSGAGRPQRNAQDLLRQTRSTQGAPAA